MISTATGPTVAHMPMTTIDADIAPRTAQVAFPLNGLASYRPKKPSKPLYQLAQEVSEQYSIPVATLRGYGRGQGLSKPRQLLMLKCRLAGHSWHAIAIYLNNRDHTTIIHGARAAERDLIRRAGGRG